ncbi:uncharacterized protein F5147DRAFT_650989 [Suillus discolor]|uniref:Uncharacterized protein n=1 Tax=Suillus discolor TaxID=1912936 RepID=A0A9P7JWH5_9AGAM|nr:uncharacterized protein F5147DRAFT_650989 [Suillus discolor]KAG2112355.1 hypothetical protein F5147DRAFT_650989 [Suillus discolor]
MAEQYKLALLRSNDPTIDPSRDHIGQRHFQDYMYPTIGLCEIIYVLPWADMRLALPRSNAQPSAHGKIILAEQYQPALPRSYTYYLGPMCDWPALPRSNAPNRRPTGRFYWPNETICTLPSAHGEIMLAEQYQLALPGPYAPYRRPMARSYWPSEIQPLALARSCTYYFGLKTINGPFRDDMHGPKNHLLGLSVTPSTTYMQGPSVRGSASTSKETIVVQRLKRPLASAAEAVVKRPHLDADTELDEAHAESARLRAENAELRTRNNKYWVALTKMHQHSQMQESELLHMSNQLYLLAHDWGTWEKELCEVLEE